MESRPPIIIWPAATHDGKHFNFFFQQVTNCGVKLQIIAILPDDRLKFCWTGEKHKLVRIYPKFAAQFHPIPSIRLFFFVEVVSVDVQICKFHEKNIFLSVFTIHGRHITVFISEIDLYSNGFDKYRWKNDLNSTLTQKSFPIGKYAFSFGSRKRHTNSPLSWKRHLFETSRSHNYGKFIIILQSSKTGMYCWLFVRLSVYPLKIVICWRNLIFKHDSNKKLHLINLFFRLRCHK